ncbi:hypothetical protein [Streptomyces sp. NPDC006132]
MSKAPFVAMSAATATLSRSLTTTKAMPQAGNLPAWGIGLFTA